MILRRNAPPGLEWHTQRLEVVGCHRPDLRVPLFLAIRYIQPVERAAEPSGAERRKKDAGRGKYPGLLQPRGELAEKLFRRSGRAIARLRHTDCEGQNAVGIKSRMHTGQTVEAPHRKP